MKWGEMVVNPRQHMYQTVHTLNKKSISRFTVKEGYDAKNLDATQNGYITKTNEFIWMIALQWNKHGLYMNIIIKSRIWWVMLIMVMTTNLQGKVKMMFIQGSDEYE
jgi:hypothetical protein